MSFSDKALPGAAPSTGRTAHRWIVLNWHDTYPHDIVGTEAVIDLHAWRRRPEQVREILESARERWPEHGAWSRQGEALGALTGENAL